jgi:hypothetical protein
MQKSKLLTVFNYILVFLSLISHPDCKLVVSHDDYSLTSKLPRERTSVVTVLRNLVDRVFNTYEFLVEVVARSLVHPKLNFCEVNEYPRVNTLLCFPNFRYMALEVLGSMYEGRSVCQGMPVTSV